MASGVFHQTPLPRFVSPAWFRMIRLPSTAGGSVGGLGTSSSLNVMYRQQSVDSLAGQRPAIGSGSTAGAALAVPVGSAMPIVPASVAATAASASLRTVAPLLWFGSIVPAPTPFPLTIGTSRSSQSTTPSEVATFGSPSPTKGANDERGRPRQVLPAD